MKNYIFYWILVLTPFISLSQDAELSDQSLDSIYISEVQDKNLPLKILHAEPLFIDLIRDYTS